MRYWVKAEYLGQFIAADAALPQLSTSYFYQTMEDALQVIALIQDRGYRARLVVTRW